MIDDFAKHYLHDELRTEREAVLCKLDGLCEYDIRRPLTATETPLSVSPASGKSAAR